MRITPETHPELNGRVTITINGVDITRRCIMADDALNVAWVLCGDVDRHRDWQHVGPTHMMPDADDRACRLVVHGAVEIVRL
jgi:hypothetical protein